MKIVNMSEARANLSRLVAEAVAGDPFIIARAGKPLVRVEVLEQAETPASRLGMLAGKIQVPDDFDRMDEERIAEDFGF